MYSASSIFAANAALDLLSIVATFIETKFKILWLARLKKGTSTCIPTFEESIHGVNPR
jgi:hypothetical protein